MKRFVCLISVLLLCGSLGVGCGGGGNSSAPALEQEAQWGDLTTRSIGGFAPPVTAASANAAVTGLSGATLTGMTLRDYSSDINATHIAFTSNRSGNNEIYTMNADGSSPTRLTTNAAGNLVPSWSPDGTKIAFLSGRDGNYEIYTMNADGSNQIRLTNNNANEYSPAWSPDGTKIAFSSFRDGNHTQIYVMNADGSNPTRLTNNTANDDFPAWSPDGKKIAFASDRGFSREIYVMNADGSNQTALTNNNADDYGPSWSPDGKKIAFVSYRDSNAEVYAMNTDGSAQINLTNNGAVDEAPFWSPDGKQIAFQSLRDGNYEIFAMSADGSSPKRLTTNTFLNQNPAWSLFVQKRILVGSGGSLGQAAAGFLFGQQADHVTSVFTFDAPNRAGVTLTSQTGASTNGSVIIFNIAAVDSLTSLAFINDFNSAVTTVLSPGNATSQVTSALVTYNAATGKVQTVLPYVQSRSTRSAVVPQSKGTTLTYRARFMGVWEASGRNLAAQGASEVQIDAKTGKVLAVR